MANPDEYSAYSEREDRRRSAEEAERWREEQEHQEERRRREAAAWRCPECGGKVYPDGEWGTAAASGSPCDICQHRADQDAEQARERAKKQAAVDEAATLDGPFGWIRALRSGGSH
ncbi:hypothetical protein ACIRO3_35175 [Streptomyces sp. NPDC102278]|uniref:hypothetical protein n=1 Tax=Streptomyces sp. NPDC102278 TaxID=3366152 RepID=UPI00380B2989